MVILQRDGYLFLNFCTECQYEPLIYTIHITTFFYFSEFYEDILSIVCTCTCFEISQSMWSVFYMLYEAFQRDAFDYFAGKQVPQT